MSFTVVRNVSVAPCVTVHLIILAGTSPVMDRFFLNDSDLYTVALCLTGVLQCQSGTRPRAQQHIVSVRVKEGTVHSSAKMTHNQSRRPQPQ